MMILSWTSVSLFCGFRCLVVAVLAAGYPRRGDRLVAVCGDEQPGGDVKGRLASVNRTNAAMMTRTSVMSALR